MSVVNDPMKDRLYLLLILLILLLLLLLFGPLTTYHQESTVQLRNQYDRQWLNTDSSVNSMQYKTNVFSIDLHDAIVRFVLRVGGNFSPADAHEYAKHLLSDVWVCSSNYKIYCS